MLLIKNKKGLFDNEVLEKYTAGIVLKGYEVKAIREGKANFDGSYVQIIGGIPYVVNMYVGTYSKQSQDVAENDLRKSRRLLLKASEIEKIQREIAIKGKTAIPTALVVTHNMVKLELAVVRGRKKLEKKHIEKERQIKRDFEVEAKEARF